MPLFRLKTLSACKGTKNKRKIQNKIWFFARLFVHLTIVENTFARKNSK